MKLHELVLLSLAPQLIMVCCCCCCFLQMKWINRHLLRVLKSSKQYFPLFLDYFFRFQFFLLNSFAGRFLKAIFIENENGFCCVSQFFFLCHWLWFHYFVTEKMPSASRVSIFLYRSRLIGHIGAARRTVCVCTNSHCVYFFFGSHRMAYP